MKKRKDSKEISKFIIGIIIFISVVYLCIAIFNISSYLNDFLYLQYTNKQDLPEFSDVFNSIFSVVNILVTSYLSYLIYNLTKKANCDSYNLNVASASYIIIKTFERWVLNIYINSLEESDLKTFSIFNNNELSNQVSKLIGFIENDEIRDGLYNLCTFVYHSEAKQNLSSIIDYNLLIKNENLNTVDAIGDIIDKFNEDRNIHQYNYVTDIKIRATLVKLYKLSRSK